MNLPLAAVRDEIADYVAALCTVYTVLIFAYIVSTLLFAFGFRPGYYRWLDVVLNFLRDVCEPYLRVFRRFIPAIGPLDLSPIVAIFLLQIVCGIVVNLIEG